VYAEIDLNSLTSNICTHHSRLELAAFRRGGEATMTSWCPWSLSSLPAGHKVDNNDGPWFVRWETLLLVQGRWSSSTNADSIKYLYRKPEKTPSAWDTRRKPCHKTLGKIHVTKNTRQSLLFAESCFIPSVFQAHSATNVFAECPTENTQRIFLH
jgi:hypothetical protein